MLWFKKKKIEVEEPVDIKTANFPEFQEIRYLDHVLIVHEFFKDAKIVGQAMNVDRYSNGDSISVHWTHRGKVECKHFLKSDLRVTKAPLSR